jgi:hypothetical protein
MTGRDHLDHQLSAAFSNNSLGTIHADRRAENGA